jgi:GGDEF domain-containing protein
MEAIEAIEAMEAMEDTVQPIDSETRILELEVRVEKLEAELKAAYTDKQFAILNRPGIEQRWHERPRSGDEGSDTVIFFDIDHIHSSNAKWGYEGTDAHIRSVMSQIDHILLFRWFSGD